MFNPMQMKPDMRFPDLSILIGSRIADVALLEPITWRFNFENGVSVCAESFWRIVSGGKVAGTSGDHDHSFGLPSPVDSAARAGLLLYSKTVKAASIRSDTGDLIIEFIGDSRLEVLTTSSGYENWNIFFPTGERFICLGGGDLHRDS
jgi:hypothetical protein